MNKDKRLLLICIVVILGLMGCNIYLQYENDKLTKEKDNVKEEVTDNTTNTKEVYYDCSFTKTYRVVDLLDGYIAEVPEMSYVVVDQYLTHSAYSHIITSELKKKLEVNKYYEFTYTLKGTTNKKINNIDDVLSYFSFNNAIRSDKRLKVLLEVKETDKQYIKHGDTFFNGAYIDYLDNNYIEPIKEQNRIIDFEASRKIKEQANKDLAAILGREL